MKIKIKINSVVENGLIGLTINSSVHDEPIEIPQKFSEEEIKANPKLFEQTVLGHIFKAHGLPEVTWNKDFIN